MFDDRLNCAAPIVTRRRAPLDDFAELRPVQAGIGAVAVEELGVRALLDDTVAVDHDNAVGGADVVLG